MKHPHVHEHAAVAPLLAQLKDIEGQLSQARTALSEAAGRHGRGDPEALAKAVLDGRSLAELAQKDADVGDMALLHRQVNILVAARSLQAQRVDAAKGLAAAEMEKAARPAGQRLLKKGLASLRQGLKAYLEFENYRREVAQALGGVCAWPTLSIATLADLRLQILVAHGHNPDVVRGELGKRLNYAGQGWEE